MYQTHCYSLDKTIKIERNHCSDGAVSRYFGCIVRKVKSMKIMGNTDRGFVLIDKDMTIRYGTLGCPMITFP